MLYREAGQFKTSYAEDQQVFAIRQDRIAVMALLVVAFVVVPLVANQYWLSAILTPLLIFMRWARTKTAAAVSAPFILLNSASGLAGNLSATKSFPAFAWALVAAVVAGGTIGSWLGSRRLAHGVIKRLLSVVLTIAGLKLIFT